MIHLFPRPTILVSLSAAGSRFSETIDNVSALICCGDALVELNSSHSIQFPRNALVCDFENGTVHVPQAFSEKSFLEMEFTSAAGTQTERFPQVNPYAEEVRDFIALLAGESTVNTTIDEAHLGVAILDALERSRSSGLAVSISEVL
jgi:predicted dehydrogenase